MSHIGDLLYDVLSFLGGALLTIVALFAAVVVVFIVVYLGINVAGLLLQKMGLL